MRNATEPPVSLPLLDRLIDLEPGNTMEVPLSRTQSLRMLRAGVRRDLEWLLNSRRIAVAPEEGLGQVNDSLYTIGLADVASFSLADGREQVRLLSHIEEIIRRFEPRLANVRITQQDDVLVSRNLRFRIEAALLIDPAPEQISFDTVLQTASGEYTVREES